MSEDTEKVDIHRGLSGVYFDRSRVCYIDGRAGELRYRGYSIHDLAERSTFEETCYLLLKGELPGTRASSLALTADLKAARTLPARDQRPDRTFKECASDGCAAHRGLGARGLRSRRGRQLARRRSLRKGVRLTSQVPMIVAAHEHIRNGRAPVAPDPTLGHAANFLYMLKGKAPSADAARLMDIDMILHAEHGSNASSFAARVVAGTEANLHAAITAAIAALVGPGARRRGGERDAAWRRRSARPSNAAEYVQA